MRKRNILTVKGNVNNFCPGCGKILWEEFFDKPCLGCGQTINFKAYKTVTWNKLNAIRSLHETPR